MNVKAPTTNKKGESGTIIIEDANFKTVQDISATFDFPNRRVLVTGIHVISTNIDTLSGGATLAVREVTLRALTAATVTLTSDATAPAANSTVALGGITYKFVSALTTAATANEVLLEVSATLTLDNLKSAINKTTGGGTKYGSDTAINPVWSAGTKTATTILCTCKTAGRAGNDEAIAYAGTHHFTTSGHTAGAGGLDGTLVNAMVTSGALSNSDDTGNVQTLSFATDHEIISGGNSLMFSITTGSTATTDKKNVVIEYRLLD